MARTDKQSVPPADEVLRRSHEVARDRLGVACGSDEVLRRLVEVVRHRHEVARGRHKVVRGHHELARRSYEARCRRVELGRRNERAGPHGERLTLPRPVGWWHVPFRDDEGLRSAACRQSMPVWSGCCAVGTPTRVRGTVLAQIAHIHLCGSALHPPQRRDICAVLRGIIHNGWRRDTIGLAVLCSRDTITHTQGTPARRIPCQECARWDSDPQPST